MPLDYMGFDIPKLFECGNGLDIDELYRNLPFIGGVEGKQLIRDWGSGKKKSERKAPKPKNSNSSQ